MKGFTLKQEVNRSTGKQLHGVHYAKPGYAPLSKKEAEK